MCGQPCKSGESYKRLHLTLFAFPQVKVSDEEKKKKEKHTFLWLTRHFGGKVATLSLYQGGLCKHCMDVVGAHMHLRRCTASLLHQTRTCGFAFDVTHIARFMQCKCVASNVRGYHEQKQIVDIVEPQRNHTKRAWLSRSHCHSACQYEKSDKACSQKLTGFRANIYFARQMTHWSANIFQRRSDYACVCSHIENAKIQK